MTNIELKPCPFCGCVPVLTHGDIKLTKSGEKIDGDLYTYWSIRCNNCGTEKSGYLSEYFFTKEETLKIRENYNGKAKAIEAWNRRAGNDER